MKVFRLFIVTVFAALVSAIVGVTIPAIKEAIDFFEMLGGLMIFFLVGLVFWFVIGMPSILILAKLKKTHLKGFLVLGLITGVIAWFCLACIMAPHSLLDAVLSLEGVIIALLFIVSVSASYLVLWAIMFPRPDPSINWISTIKVWAGPFFICGLILLFFLGSSFVKSRRASRTSSCIGNLRQLDAAKEQAAMDLNLPEGSKITRAQADNFIKSGTEAVRCPSDPKPTFDTSYSLERIGSKPLCLHNPGSHTL